MRISLYLVYIYYRKLFAKGDVLTITALIGGIGVVLYALYQHYQQWWWVLCLFPISTFAHHNSRGDLSLLKMQQHYRRILIGEYFIENLPFLLLIFFKENYLVWAVYFCCLLIVPFLPQRNWVFGYPFFLTDPFWHIAFRKYKLLLGGPIAVFLIVVGAIYENPNVALFALGFIALLSCIPYFEREHIAHIVASDDNAREYFYKQLKTGVWNGLLLQLPIGILYGMVFKGLYIEVLPLFLLFPVVGVITKYAFFSYPIRQSFVLVFMLLGAVYILPIIALPYFYYLAYQNLKKYQNATDNT